MTHRCIINQSINIFISLNLSNCCQIFKQTEIWFVQIEIINHPVPKINMFDSTELKWTVWRPIKLKNIVLALTNALNRECAPARSNKICTVGSRHVINALKISRVSAYHLCSTISHIRQVFSWYSRNGDFSAFWYTFMKDNRPISYRLWHEKIRTLL